MKKYYFFLIIYFFSVSLFSQTWYRKENNNGLCGYVDSTGAIKIPFEYLDAYQYEFKDSVAFVAVLENGKDKLKVIDRNNKRLYTLYTVYDTGENPFRIQDDSTDYIGFADMNDKMIIPPRFFYVDLFSEGFAAFNEGGKFEELDEEHTVITGGKWGYIDKTGKGVFPAIFDKVSSFEEGKAEVQIGEYVFNLFHEE